MMFLFFVIYCHFSFYLISFTRGIIFVYELNLCILRRYPKCELNRCIIRLPIPGVIAKMCFCDILPPST